MSQCCFLWGPVSIEKNRDILQLEGIKPEFHAMTFFSDGDLETPGSYGTYQRSHSEWYWFYDTHSALSNVRILSLNPYHKPER